ncbi:hypothetical protein OQA88_8766 [Cercophora sp. LCS_1]
MPVVESNGNVAQERLWPEAFNSFKNRCGIEKLKAFLSQQLGEQFSKVLPEVKKKVHARIKEIERELGFYPKPPKDADLEIMRSLTGFDRDVKDCIEHQEFLDFWDATHLEPFKAKILSLKPIFNIKELRRADKAAPSMPTAPIHSPVVIDLNPIDLPPLTNS